MKRALKITSLIATVIIITSVVANPFYTYAADNINVSVNGTYIDFSNDTQPVIYENRTYVPIRKVCEALNITVNYEDYAKTMVFFKGNNRITHVLGSNIIEINGYETKFDTPSININGRTLMPVRMLAESINAEVNWDPASRTVIIKYEDLAKSDKTEAYQKFTNIVTNKAYMEEPFSDSIYYTDKYGNEWYEACSNNNALVVYTSIEDYNEAVKLAEELGTKFEYTLPITANPESNWYYNVIIPIYTDTSAHIIAARPTSLYPSGYKMIEQLYFNDNQEVLVLKTKTTASFRMNIHKGNDITGLMWGQDWFPEEFDSMTLQEQAEFDKTFDSGEFAKA